MFRFVILVAFLGAAATAENVGRPCVSGGGSLPISFEIEGCVAAPCALPQLEDATIKVKFNALPFDLGQNAQACSGLANASCPVKEGQDLDYVLKLPIEVFFPVGAAVTLEISVADDSGSPAFCARVPVVIAPPRN